MELSEEEKKSIERLEEYNKNDVFYNGNAEVESDFDKFCYNHCKDIDVVLKLVEELKIINNMQKYRIEVIDERELISKDKLRNILEKYGKKPLEDDIVIKFYKELQKLSESE